MSNLFSFLKFTVFFSILCAAIYFGGSITINIANKTIDMHIAVIVLALIILVYMYNGASKLINRIFAFFRGKPSYEKGIDNLQLAFSGILLKDKSLAEKNIKKAQKHLGNIPLISWIEGQLMLLKNEHHNAKSIFYELCTREKGTALGAYSLCKMAVVDKSENDALNAINTILKVSPHALELIFQAIAISLKNKNFNEAKKHIRSIKNTKKGRFVEAIIYSEEGIANKNIDLLKKALKLAPELAETAIQYADILCVNGEYKDARKILLKSFQHQPTLELYDKYISCGELLDISDRLKLAEKIMEEAPDSWIVYFEFAKIAMQKGMMQIAFHHFLKAYNKEKYDFIAEKLVTSANLLDDPKPQAAIDILSNPLSTKHIDFIWRCKECGNEEKQWIAVCNHCNRIGEYFFMERLMDNNYFLIEKREV